MDFGFQYKDIEMSNGYDPKILEIKCSELGLSTNALNICNAVKKDCTIRDLLEAGKSYIRATRRCGKTYLDEIVNAVLKHGIEIPN